VKQLDEPAVQKANKRESSTETEAKNKRKYPAVFATIHHDQYTADDITDINEKLNRNG
jgi:hypothetical protein